MRVIYTAALLALLAGCGGGAECESGEPAFGDKQAKFHADCDAPAPPAPPASAASAGG